MTPNRAASPHAATPPENNLTALFREALRRGRQLNIRARGHSMRPLIPDGSIVEVRPMSGRLRIGDIVAAQRGQRLYIHRVHAVEPMVLLWGDGNRRPDRSFQDSDILGRVHRIRTPAGWHLRLDTRAATASGQLIVRFVQLRARLHALRHLS
jgi:hypothetical protein